MKAMYVSNDNIFESKYSPMAFYYKFKEEYKRKNYINDKMKILKTNLNILIYILKKERNVFNLFDYFVNDSDHGFKYFIQYDDEVADIFDNEIDFVMENEDDPQWSDGRLLEISIAMKNFMKIKISEDSPDLWNVISSYI